MLYTLSGATGMPGAPGSSHCPFIQLLVHRAKTRRRGLVSLCSGFLATYIIGEANSSVKADTGMMTDLCQTPVVFAP